jgi:hypothetical protein
MIPVLLSGIGIGLLVASRKNWPTTELICVKIANESAV